jgi:serine/threonine protein kinase
MDHISEAYICELFKPLVDAIRFCHEYSIVHRDIKPENILFSAAGPSSLKIADFGLSRIVGD